MKIQPQPLTTIEILTYSIAELSDAAAMFTENIAKGEDPQDEFKIVVATFEKKKSVCPKCGRALSRQGAECINCASKGKLAKQRTAFHD